MSRLVEGRRKQKKMTLLEHGLYLVTNGQNSIDCDKTCWQRTFGKASRFGGLFYWRAKPIHLTIGPALVVPPE